MSLWWRPLRNRISPRHGFLSRSILYTKELAVRQLIPPPISNRIVAISVHPGAVATDQPQAVKEPYGVILGSLFATAASALFMSPEQGAESALWAATSPKVSSDAQRYQGAYLSQPDDSVSLAIFMRRLPGRRSKTALKRDLAMACNQVFHEQCADSPALACHFGFVALLQLGNETDQAKDMELAKRLWALSVQVLKDKVGVNVDEQ